MIPFLYTFVLKDIALHRCFFYYFHSSIDIFYLIAQGKFMVTLSEYIRESLKAQASAETAIQYERYMKNAVRFIGVRSPALDLFFKKLYADHIKPKTIAFKFDLALKLLKSPFQEEKKLAILILNKISKQLTTSDLDILAELFKSDIYEWATCDVFSSKVVTQIIKQNPDVADHILTWKDSPNLWQQRSACVSFVTVARFGNFNNQIISICSTVIKNSMRFAQLGAGWVLRELYLADPTLTVSFIKENYNYFSREGLRYAIEKMEPDLQKELLGYKVPQQT
jgi:3-methyladenine DNA glycosylase AlkD